MENIACSCLSEKQIKDLEVLLNICSKKDDYNYSVYCENENQENNCFYLLYNEDVLCAFAGCFTTDCSELSVLFHPDYRSNDHYSEFMDFVMDDLWNQGLNEIYIVGNKDHEWFNELVSSYDAAYSHSEYLMSISELKEIQGLPDIEYTISKILNEDHTIYELMVDNKKAGHCKVTASGNLTNIWDVFIDPRFRNNGLGRLLIKDVVAKLIEGSKNDQKIILQVSSINRPAFRIYSICGFTIENSIDYFHTTL